MEIWSRSFASGLSNGAPRMRGRPGQAGAGQIGMEVAPVVHDPDSEPARGARGARRRGGEGRNKADGENSPNHGEGPPNDSDLPQLQGEGNARAQPAPTGGAGADSPGRRNSPHGHIRDRVVEARGGAMSKTRKLAAIVFADVVGYSRLMGEDELGAARAVRERREAARPIVTSHGGRIVQTIGDGMMLEFPSVVAAVECAIAIQALMAERNAATLEAKHIRYRIGVNLGDMLIEGDDIVGDSVNIAARLESICEPGGIFVSGAAHDHVRGRIEADFVDLGEKALKNIARPVRVYAVRPSSGEPTPAVPSRPPGSSEPPHLSIVVLPFANLTGDPEQDYFADGVTESLTIDLSRIVGSFVIG